MITFLIEIFHLFRALDPLQQLLVVCTLFGSPILATATLLRWAYQATLSRERELQVSLEDALAKANARKAELEAEMEALARQVPAERVQRARRERREGNEELALRQLRFGVEETAPGLAEACLELAKHHLGVPDDELESNLPLASRYARLATLLAPNEQTASRLVAEIQEIDPIINSAPATAPAYDADFYGIDAGIDPRHTVLAMSQASTAALTAGHLRRSLRLAERALLIGDRHLAIDDPIVLHARREHARTLSELGEAASALDAIDTVLTAQKRQLGPEHPDVLVTIHARAQVLRLLDRPQEALRIVEKLLPVVRRVRGAQHPDLARTLFLWVQLLRHVGQPQKALKVVNALRPVEERMLGSDHPDVLATRYLQALLLYEQGQLELALNASDELLTLQKRRIGPEHPNFGRSLMLRARIENDLGHFTNALDHAAQSRELFRCALPAQHAEVKNADTLFRAIEDRSKKQK